MIITSDYGSFPHSLLSASKSGKTQTGTGLSVVKSQRGTGCRMSHVILHPRPKSGPGLSGFFRRPEVYQAGRSYMSGQHKVALSALNLDPPSPEKLHSPSSEAHGSF